jgi:hypothetical protein
MDVERTKYLRELRRNIVAHFNLEELQTITFDVGLDWDDIPGGETKGPRTQNLLKTLIHRGRLGNLITLLREIEPAVEWPDAPPPEQQLADDQFVGGETGSSTRDALLRSANDLQSRVYNIVKQGFLQVYGVRYPDFRDYALHNTCYVVAEYLCWVEILRRSGQFIDLGVADKNQRLESSLVEVAHTFSRDDIGHRFMLFRGEQRAIGEVMIAPADQPGSPLRSIGYAEFVRRLADDEFSLWFLRLRGDIELLMDNPQNPVARLILLQRALIGLLDVLDPDQIRIGQSYRKKIPLPAQISPRR